MSKQPQQPDKFFADAKSCLALLQGIPVVAIEALKRDESTRDVIVSIIRTCYRISDAAELDLVAEFHRQFEKENTQNKIQDLMSDDREISLEELKRHGLKLSFNENGPIVVPA